MLSPRSPRTVKSVRGSHRCAWSSASRIVVTNTTNQTRPGVSKRHEGGGPGRGTRRVVRRTATAPIGKLTRNIERQPKYWVRKPPTTGPNALDVTRSEERRVGKECRS